MPRANLKLESTIVKSGRLAQLQGIFELPPGEHSSFNLEVSLPLEEREWNVGLIVGPSGSGKTSVARALFAEHLLMPFSWEVDRSIVDSFPESMSIHTITELLSSVGFSDPPGWLKPFGVLSNGEQFRVNMARALAEHERLVVIDEFTSVVDRTVAKTASCALQRTVRAMKKQVIGVSCHYDIIEWLCPDWIYEPAINQFQWRYLQQRPEIVLNVRRVDKSAWRLFREHHYLNTELHPMAHCYVAFIEQIPVAFIAVLKFPHLQYRDWRLHRLVCLPDYQGVGIGVALSDYVSSLYRAAGGNVYRTAGHPAVVRHCAKSKKWTLRRKLARQKLAKKATLWKSSIQLNTHATHRRTAGFMYVGPAAPIEHVEGFAILKSEKAREKMPGAAAQNNNSAAPRTPARAYRTRADRKTRAVHRVSVRDRHIDER